MFANVSSRCSHFQEMKFFLFLCILSIDLLKTQAIIPLLDPKILSLRIAELFENALTVEAIQEHFDSLNYIENKLRKSDTDEIIESINQKFQEQIQAVRNLKRAAEVSYAVTGNRETEDCCRTHNLAYIPRYRTQVDESNSCFSFLDPSTSSFFPVNNFTSICKQNAVNFSSLKWQYFATERSLTLRYPKTQSFCILERNPLQSSWFFQAYVPQRIQIAVVMDTSRSMGNRANGIPILSLVVRAIKDILSPLDNYDQFALVTASENTKGPGEIVATGDCFAETFARGTPNNKERMTEFLDALRANGRTLFINALIKAFGYFAKENETDAQNETNKIILFVSNGEPEEPLQNIADVFKRENAKLNNSVRFFAYGLGNANFSIFNNLSTLNPILGKEGLFHNIEDPTNVIEVLPNYYLNLSTPNTEDPTWTAPYLDNGNLGQIMTASLPVFVNNTRIGVVASDVRLDDLVLLSKFFKPSEFSYSFIIDGKGLVLNHLNFPNGIKTPSNLVDATILEQDAEFLSVLDSMKRGESGSKTFNATRFKDRGSAPNNAVKKVTVLSQYIWKKVNHTDFSVCLILALNDSTIEISSQDSVPPDTFLHIRTDLVPPRVPCSHIKLLSSFNETSTFFATRAFDDPDDYIFSNYTREDIESIRMYMEGTGPNKFNIKEEAKRDVVATFKAEELWKATGVQPWLRHVAWRYIGTKHGIFRMLPAGNLPKFFDPTVRPWYVDAQANPDKFIIGLPHVGTSRELDIDVAKAIMEPEQKLLNRELAGAVGATVFLEFFRGIVSNLYSNIFAASDYKFYLTNSGGYMIIADQLSRTDENTHLHLSQVEPEIASLLILNNVMRRVSCSRVDIGEVQWQYELKLPSNESEFRGIIKTDVGENCREFLLAFVPDTNTFILIRALFTVNCGNISFLTSGGCTCLNDLKACATSWDGNNDCECPCMAPNPSINPCKNTLKTENTSSLMPPCTPVSSIDFDIPLPNVTLNTNLELPICYELFLGLDADNSFSVIVISTSLSALVFIIFLTSTVVYLHMKSVEDKAKVRAKQNAVGALIRKSSRESTFSKGSTLAPSYTRSKTRPDFAQLSHVPEDARSTYSRRTISRES